MNNNPTPHRKPKPKERCLVCNGVCRMATTDTTTFDDGTFVRTALMIEGTDTGSVDVVNKAGKRLCQINISLGTAKECDEYLIVDVIDVDKRYTKRRALVFSPDKRAEMDVPEGGNLVSTDFRKK